MNGLTPTQFARFDKQGYLAIDVGLIPKDFQKLIEDFDTIMDRHVRDTCDKTQPINLFEKDSFKSRLKRICEVLDNPDDLLEKIHGKLRTQGIFGLMTHRTILNIIESIIGPEIMVHPSFHPRAKMPRDNKGAIPWHQDLAYLESDAMNTRIIIVWVPLVDATIENGCVELVAGSHKHGLIKHHRGDSFGWDMNFKGILEKDLPPGDRIHCPIKVGSILLMHCMTIHRSGINRSKYVRWSVDFRYQDPSMPSGRYDSPGVIVRSESQPELIIQCQEDWLALCTSHYLRTKQIVR